MEFDKLEHELKQYDAVKSISYQDDKMIVTIRSKIKSYDEEMVEHLLSTQNVSAIEKDVLRNLSDYEQEHTFAIKNDDGFFGRLLGSCHIALIENYPVGAFGCPYRSLGQYEHYMYQAVRDEDYSLLAYLMVDEVRSINVSDIAIMRQFMAFAKENNV